MELVTQNTIQKFIKYLSDRNLDELTDLFSNEIDWHIPGDKNLAPWVGTRSNKQEVSAFYELLWKNTEPISVKVDNIYIDNNKAVIAGDFSTKMLQTGKVVNSLFFIQMTVENGLITKYILLEDTLAVAKCLTV